uniref:Uncharacterized protein n=1 Tax=Octopus bimaculoides TaxID=37653 RepID=A0A0L8HFI8_OCTBM
MTCKQQLQELKQHLTCKQYLQELKKDESIVLLKKIVSLLWCMLKTSCYFVDIELQ